MTEKTFQQLSELESGTILEDAYHGGVRYLIMRGPGALCAYVGVPSGHALSGEDYDNIDLECHGGLTFSGAGSGEYHPEGFYWFGWDYAHCGDKTFYDLQDDPDDTPWTLSMVRDEVRSVMCDFIRLIKLSERIVVKAGGKIVHG